MDFAGGEITNFTWRSDFTPFTPGTSGYLEDHPRIWICGILTNGDRLSPQDLGFC